jgi:predicted dehydrogenase
MKTVKFGVIGCGLMGKEFASAAARWCHLSDDIAKPEIVAVCDFNEEATAWFKNNFASVNFVTKDYKELLKREDVEAVYCALPHNLHAGVYSDIIRAGKHLLGEKPFGIDKQANEEILQAIKENPKVVVRCASEFPFYPACQQLIKWIKENKFGKIIEVRAGFHHSSDMDINKPINWKRMVAINGEYGCIGDLGLHTQHVPFRMGWKPKKVYASLSNIVTERPDKTGKKVPCDTWDNAVMMIETEDSLGNTFPMTLETKRMAPGATNDWFLEVYGLECSAKFNSSEPDIFAYTNSWGKEQAWCKINMGYKPMIPTITGGIFEFGFTDAILQMWATFIKEIEGKEVFFGCCTPEETELSHKLNTAALISYKEGRAVEIK